TRWRGPPSKARWIAHGSGRYPRWTPWLSCEPCRASVSSFAQGILMRGAGLVDAVTDDDLTPRAIQLLYALGERPNRAAVLQRAEAWRPYRMWALVLLNVWLRGQPPDVKGRRGLRRRPK